MNLGPQVTKRMTFSILLETQLAQRGSCCPYVMEAERRKGLNDLMDTNTGHSRQGLSLV